MLAGSLYAAPAGATAPGTSSTTAGAAVSTAGSACHLGIGSITAAGDLGGAGVQATKPPTRTPGAGLPPLPHLFPAGSAKLADFEHEGKRVAASRLGYRMTDKLATKYFGRIFLHPDVVFTPEMLRPELQDVGIFAESVATIVTTHERVARSYFEDGTIALAIPPLRALLEIMADGSTAQGWGLDSPEFRIMFTREAVLASDWYAQRLDAKQVAASARADAGLAAIEKFVTTAGNEEPTARLDMPARVEAARVGAQQLAGPEYRAQLVGTVGSTPL